MVLDNPYVFPLQTGGGGGGGDVEIVQGTGQATDKVMSQKATTDELNAKQDKHKYIRIQNETKTITTGEAYTDVFVYDNATVQFGDATVLDNLKTLFVSRGCTIGTSTGITAINIDLEQHNLPYTTPQSIFLVGFTSDSIPMFTADTNVMPKFVELNSSNTTYSPTANDTNIYIKAASGGTSLSLSLMSQTKVIDSFIIDGSENAIQIFGAPAPALSHLRIDGELVDISGAGYSLSGMYAVVGKENATTLILQKLDVYMLKNDGVGTGATRLESLEIRPWPNVPQYKFAHIYEEDNKFYAKFGLWGNTDQLGLELRNDATPSNDWRFALKFSEDDSDCVMEVVPTVGGGAKIIMHYKFVCDGFTQVPEDPPTDTSIASKKYVDTKVSKTGNETIGGVKTFTDGIKTNGVTANVNNSPVKIAGPVIELETRQTNGETVTAKLIVAGSENPSTTPHSVHSWENGTMDLGTPEYKFKDGYFSGNLNGEIPFAEIQRYSKLLRVQNDGNTGYSLTSNEWTDIFAYQGKLIFKNGFTGKQIKSFYMNKDFILENDGGVVTKINVDFTEKTLPYTAESKMHLVGYTQSSDNTICPLFQTEKEITVTNNPDNTVDITIG